jgi:hypothetical protein
MSWLWTFDQITHNTCTSTSLVPWSKFKYHMRHDWHWHIMCRRHHRVPLVCERTNSTQNVDTILDIQENPYPRLLVWSGKQIFMLIRCRGFLSFDGVLKRVEWTSSSSSWEETGKKRRRRKSPRAFSDYPKVCLPPAATVYLVQVLYQRNCGPQHAMYSLTKNMTRWRSMQGDKLDQNYL